MNSRRLVIKKTIIMTVMIILFVLIVSGSIANSLSKDRFIDRLITKKIEINGSMQWISMTENQHKSGKPVVLFLHGGPGSANISLLNQITPGINDHAIIVNWDQRNAGKSFSIFKSRKALSFEQNIEDAHELTQYLKDFFNVDKITLIGFSAGTALGIMLVDRYPEDYDLYISVAQMVNGQQGESLSLEYTIKKAQELNDTKALSELEKIHFDFTKPKEILKNTQKQRKYLLKYGGVYHNYDNYSHEAKSLWQSKEYTFSDFVFWPMASLVSLKAMWHEVVLLKIEELVPVVNVPIVFFCGKYDMNNPTLLVKEYYENLVAPKGKELVLFEHSAHAIFWDEQERFEAEVIKALDKYTKIKNHTPPNNANYLLR